MGQAKNLARDLNMKANRPPNELLLQVDLAGGLRKGRKGLSNDGPIISADQQWGQTVRSLAPSPARPACVMIDAASYLILYGI